jgi:hypothetical protein
MEKRRALRGVFLGAGARSGQIPTCKQYAVRTNLSYELFVRRTMKKTHAPAAQFEAWATDAGLELDRDEQLLCYNCEVTRLAHQAWVSARHGAARFEPWALERRLPLEQLHGQFAGYETRMAFEAWQAAQQRLLAA